MSEQCCERVWQGYRWGKCLRTATVERDGWYCWQHDPEYVARQAQKQREQWSAEEAKITRRAAEAAACESVPTDVLETVRVAELLTLLRRWFEHGELTDICGNDEMDIVARTRAALEGESDG